MWVRFQGPTRGPVPDFEYIVHGTCTLYKVVRIRLPTFSHNVCHLIVAYYLLTTTVLYYLSSNHVFEVLCILCTAYFRRKSPRTQDIAPYYLEV